jgi:predicted amidohydrolase
MRSTQKTPVPGTRPDRPLRVAAVACRSEFGNVPRNLDVILRWVESAAAQGADLVCFPEVALQGYCSLPGVIRDLAEAAEGPSCRALTRAAAQWGVTVSLGMSLRDGARVYNSQVFVGPAGFLGAQHKVHLGGIDRAYDPGHAWEVYPVGGWLVGATICFDSEFPEAARILALRGAHLVVMSFATGRRSSLNEPARPEEWKGELMAWAPARAYDNRIYVVGVNHAGDVRDERGLAVANPEGNPAVEEWAPPGTVHRWPGYCFALSPRGVLCAESEQAGRDESMLLVDLDPEVFEKARSPIEVKWPSGTVAGHFLKVRRTDTFGGLLSPPRDFGPG